LAKQAVALAIHRDGASGGVIRLAVINKDGTHREVYRKDLNELPDFVPATVYPLLSKQA
jgi:20S proteasome alpha/beta subunit